MVPEAPPAWVAEVFAHTDAPQHAGPGRLRRTATAMLDVGGRPAVVVTVSFCYLTLDGTEETAQAKVFLPPDFDGAAARRPLVYNAGYELPDDGAVGYLREGCVVVTPHAHPKNPLSRGPNLDLALLHASRALPFVDGRRIWVTGGSAGGWATLMVAAESFPLAGAAPLVPPVDWGYNGAYIATQGGTGEPPADPPTSPMPILGVVGPLAVESRQYCGLPWDAAIYWACSPTAAWDTITAPTQVFWSTADMLVPIDQVGAEWVRPHDVARFPAGFTTSPARLLPGAPRPPLLEVLPDDVYELFVPDLPAERIAMKPDGTAEPGTPPPVVLPYSTTRPWAVIILDEGPVEPHVGHFKYAWNFDFAPFRAWAIERGCQPEQLTAPKLRRLMSRLAATPWIPATIRQGEAEVAATLLDWPEAERADVLAGLRAFAEDHACARRLAEVYDDLNAADRALGPRLGDGTPAGVRAFLTGLD